MTDHPNVWTDGSKEDVSSVGGFEVAGAGDYLPASEHAFENLVWGTVEEYGDARLERNKPLPLVKDGDLIALVQYMIRTRGWETVRVTKVKGHAEDVVVQQGRVRLIDQQGNAEADTAADLSRRHQSEVLIDARRRSLKALSPLISYLCWIGIDS